MARSVRVSPVGVPQHIVQRGNNRQVFFAGKEDMQGLSELAERIFYKIQSCFAVLITIVTACLAWICIQ